MDSVSNGSIYCINSSSIWNICYCIHNTHSMGFINVRIIDPSQLSVNMIIYNVHAFAHPNKFSMTAIHKFKVIKFPITTDNGMQDFIKVAPYQEYIKVNFKDNTWDIRKYSLLPSYETKSMQDMGIIPNKYNMHQTFDNMKDAKQYTCSVLNLNITSSRGAYDRAMKVLDI